MMCLVYIVAADEAEAEKLSESLLNKRLVACVNSFPVKSRYWWKGKIETGSEIAMLAKTREELTDKIIEEVRKIHSYEVPVIDVLTVSSSYKDVIDWLNLETRQEE
jgi:periplasmic divalent cation tolerance protein